MLIEKALEGMLSDEERRQFEELLEQRPEVRKEFESLKGVKEVTMELKLRKPPEETWDRYWGGVYARMERGIGWMLISIGAAVVLAFAGYHAVAAFFEDTSTPFLLKLALAALAFGGAILLVSVAREKLIMRKTDKYKEVIR
jgi:anti-sigma factor RsiW